MKRGMEDSGGQDNVKYRVSISNIPPNTSFEELDYLLTFIFKTSKLDIQSLRQDSPGKTKRATLVCNSQAEAVNLKAQLDKMPYNGYIISAFLIGYTTPSMDNTPVESYIPDKASTRQSNDPWGYKLGNQGPPNDVCRFVTADRGRSNMIYNSIDVNTPSRNFRQSNYVNREQTESSASYFGNEAFEKAPFEKFRETTYAKSSPYNELCTTKSDSQLPQHTSSSRGQLNEFRENQGSSNNFHDTDYSIQDQMNKFRRNNESYDSNKINIKDEVSFREYDNSIGARINKIRQSHNVDQGSEAFSGADTRRHTATTKCLYDANFGEQDFRGAKSTHERHQRNTFQQCYSVSRGQTTDLNKPIGKQASLQNIYDVNVSPPALLNKFEESAYRKKEYSAFGQSDSLNARPTGDFGRFHSTKQASANNFSCDSAHLEQARSGYNSGNQEYDTFQQYDSMNRVRLNEFGNYNSEKDALFNMSNSQSNSEKRTPTNVFCDSNFDNYGTNEFCRPDYDRWGRSKEFDGRQLDKSAATRKHNVWSQGQRSNDSLQLNESKDERMDTQSTKEMSFDDILKQVEIRKKIMEQQNIGQRQPQTSKPIETSTANTMKKVTPSKKSNEKNTVNKVTPPKKSNKRAEPISREALPVSFGKPEQSVKEKKKTRSKFRLERKPIPPKVAKSSGGWSAAGPPKKLPSEELGQKIMIEQAILVVVKQHEKTLEKLRVYKGIWEGCLDIAKGEVGDKMYELIGEHRMASVEEAIEIYRKSVPQHKDEEIISEARRRLGTRVFDTEPFGRYMDTKEEAELRQAMQIEELKDPYTVISNVAEDNCWYIDYQLDKILTKVHKQNILEPDEEEHFKDVTPAILEQKVLSDEHIPAVERCIDQHLVRLLPKIKDYMMELICRVEDGHHEWLALMIHDRVTQLGVSHLPHEPSPRELHHVAMVSKAPSLHKLLKPYQIPAVWQLQSRAHRGALLALPDGMQYEDLLCRNGCIVEGQKVLIYPAEKIEEMAEVERDKCKPAESREGSPGVVSSASSTSQSRGSSPYYPWDAYSSRESSPDIVLVENTEVIEID